MNLHFLANPARFLRFSAKIRPVLLGLWVILILIGLWQGLVISPTDYQQGESVRLMYIHVPCAWLSMMGYTVLAGAGASFLIWKHPLAALAARAAAPLGALFTAICLITGMLWGKPTWGTWWVWDARLTSVLVLFFLYLGHIMLTNAHDQRDRADRSAAVLALLGLANLPVIKFSVDWWQTLHQPASLSSFKRLANPTIDSTMLTPLLLMAAGMTVLYFWLLFTQIELELYRQKGSLRR